MMMTKRGKDAFYPPDIYGGSNPKKPLFLHLSTGLPDGKEFFGVFWGVPMRLAAIDGREEQRNH